MFRNTFKCLDLKVDHIILIFYRKMNVLILDQLKQILKWSIFQKMDIISMVNITINFNKMDINEINVENQCSQLKYQHVQWKMVIKHNCTSISI